VFGAFKILLPSKLHAVPLSPLAVILSAAKNL